MIQVREYAYLSCDNNETPSIDMGIISPFTFDWLIELQAQWKKSVPVLHQKGKKLIKLDSYVGFLQSPTGESIEILPKTQHKLPGIEELESVRGLLRRMVLCSLNLNPREAGPASLQALRTPMHEWIFAEFLRELTALVRRGLRSDYLRVEEESRFVRGQLAMTKQLRQRQDRAHWFHIRHDIYSPNCVENRLLKTAIDYTIQLTKDSGNWRLANELAHLLSELPAYHNPLRNLHKWRSGKLMQSYNAVQPWCELILEHLNPNFQAGKQKGIALLFPMFRLFESYVGAALAKQLPASCALKKQASNHYLLRHRPAGTIETQSWFQLKPDFLLATETGQFVLDAKWKLLDSLAPSDKYGLSESDMYQLFAYGHKYMGGKGHMVLIFPAHLGFRAPSARLSMEDELHCWLVPFDLKKETLLGGEWENYLPHLSGKTA